MNLDSLTLPAAQVYSVTPVGASRGKISAAATALARRVRRED